MCAHAHTWTCQGRLASAAFLAFNPAWSHNQTAELTFEDAACAVVLLLGDSCALECCRLTMDPLSPPQSACVVAMHTVLAACMFIF